MCGNVFIPNRSFTHTLSLKKAVCLTSGLYWWRKMLKSVVKPNNNNQTQMLTYSVVPSQGRIKSVWKGWRDNVGSVEWNLWRRRNEENIEKRLISLRFAQLCFVWFILSQIFYKMERESNDLTTPVETQCKPSLMFMVF